MADEEEQIDPTASGDGPVDDPAPDPSQDPAEVSGEAPAEAASSEGEGADDAASGDDEPTNAGILAEEALKAAQDAIAGLGGGEDAAPAMDDSAAAALKAAQAAIAGLSGGGAAPAESSNASEADIEAQMMAAMASDPGASGTPFDLPSFSADGGGAASSSEIDLLSDVNLNVKIELGRTRMLIEDVLRLGDGAVVELDKLAGDPVDVFVNDRHIARGEVLVLNDNFCVRINEIVKPASDDARSA
ncbi:MAG: flagellar motor switch protein FliN [Phycisphaerales bacterium]|nr:flagellar motor switch protein FliN [Phycisphaerales bacterium]